MLPDTEALPESPTQTTSRAARRRLITRALLRNVPETSDPRRTLFHFEQEMAEEFAKSRLSSYAAIPALVILMGTALGFLGDFYKAALWVTAMLGLHAYALAASRSFLREGLARASLYVWKRRFINRDLAYGLCWAIFPLLIPRDADVEIANGISIIKLAAVIVVLSVGALLASPIPAAAVASTLPIALCMAAVHVFEPNFFNITIALCTLGAEMLFLHLTSHLYDQHARSLAFRAEKDAIFAELEQAKRCRRGAAPCGSSQHGEVAVSGDHESRTPDAIECHSGLLRTHARRDARPDRHARLQDLSR
jgi:two-component system cell cycle sensor histidine kinase PleC